MEAGVAGSKLIGDGGIQRVNSKKDQVRVNRKTLEAVLEDCRRAIESLNNTGSVDDDGGGDGDGDGDGDGLEPDGSEESSSTSCLDREADELCGRLKSRLECPDFLVKLENAQASVLQSMVEDGSSWDMVCDNDLWEGRNAELDDDDYVLVRQEDIVEGMACFVAAYLLSIKQTKELTPNQLQEALSKTFSATKKKGKLRKAWDGSKVIYNVASWGATAIGIYQNPALVKAASAAFWTSCNVVAKLL